MLKSVGKVMTPGIDGLPYEVYLRPCLSPYWNFSSTTGWNRGLFLDVSPGGVLKFLCKNKHEGDGVGNFCPLTMLNAELKVLAKVLANRL